MSSFSEKNGAKIFPNGNINQELKTPTSEAEAKRVTPVIATRYATNLMHLVHKVNTEQPGFFPPNWENLLKKIVYPLSGLPEYGDPGSFRGQEIKMIKYLLRTARSAVPRDEPWIKFLGIVRNLMIQNAIDDKERRKAASSSESASASPASPDKDVSPADRSKCWRRSTPASPDEDVSPADHSKCWREKSWRKSRSRKFRNSRKSPKFRNSRKSRK
jgi:hypothetical protein